MAPKGQGRWNSYSNSQVKGQSENGESPYFSKPEYMFDMCSFFFTFQLIGR